MKNITVSVDEETHRLARIRAAELGTSVSALVRGCLKTLVRKRVDQTAASRRLGFMAGQIKVPDGFDSIERAGDRKNVRGERMTLLLVAQAQVENVTLLTTDYKVACYTGPIQAV